jgi:hypothetical protein
VGELIARRRWIPRAAQCLLLFAAAGCTPMPEQTHAAISDWRSGKPDTECEIPGEAIQWQADYCMAYYQTDDLVAADACMRVESRTGHGEECARRRHFKQEWCRLQVKYGPSAQTLAQCIADPAQAGATVRGGGTP